ncbi:hypothetical protein [Streptomyces sp. HNM0574]|uniref:hypothetical protein n=1 Tax=Streptomyces sp. HNM0574 TaxID=2714954 RepID=UPI00146EFC6A|nr:hypothetical protein [Streptomyces sp. HNM0574]NLU66675.1 hypothetical protein [Streptomyces sp. HNM0574]
MKLYLTPTTAARITDEPLGHLPRFAFSGPHVTVGPYVNAADRERGFADTFGSMQWLWSETDDVRFREQDRKLCGLVLYAPEAADPAPEVSRSWTACPVVTGGLRAVSASGFDLPQAVTRWSDAEAGHLVCLGEDRPQGERFRLRVAPDTDLLFRERRLVGWMLTDPARYLSSGWESPDPHPPETSTRSLLAECLALTSDPLVEDVMDGDDSAWHRLRGVVCALSRQETDRARAAILAETMDHLFDSYA